MANISSVPSKESIGHKGREQYSHVKADAHRDKRREQADVRQSKYEALSIPAKIARAKSRRGDSKKELARLLKILKNTSPADLMPKTTIPPPREPEVKEVLYSTKPRHTPKSKVIAAAKTQRPSKS